MARTKAQIAASMIAAVQSDAVIGTAGSDPLTSTSAVAVWRAWCNIIAGAQQTLEGLFDDHKTEVAGIITDTLPGRLGWYEAMALAFQYGATLPPDTDEYNPVAPAGDPSLIVSYAAAVNTDTLLRMKVATLAAGVLAPLSGAQLTAFTAYMQRIKYAGVRMQCTSGAPDTLRTGITVYYDPLVLDGNGKRLDGTNDTPLQTAINALLAGLSFNGVFIKNNLIATMQSVDGVTIADLQYCAAAYAAVPYATIDADYVPDAGYMILDTAFFAANTTYLPYAV